MNKIETIIIALVLAVACPLLALVTFWWGSAAAGRYVTTVPDGAIKVAALAGLGAGVLGDLLFLKRWVAAFYTARWAWVAAVYLGLSVVALAFCMGVPIGTFAVGVTGGVYLGRRLRHTIASGSVVSRTLTRGALCAASLTTLFALPVGLMALHEPIVLRAAAAFGLEARTISGPVGQASMVTVCLILFGLQFWSTREAGFLAFRLQQRSGQPAAPSECRPHWRSACIGELIVGGCTFHMKELYYGYYATRIYLPLSSLSRRWRRFSHRLRGKHDRFLQFTRLHEISWKSCTHSHRPRIWEPKKENGNVRVSELGVISALAADCEDGTNLFEIGTFDGRTTLNLALNSPPRCQVYTLDLPPDLEAKFESAKGERHMIDKLKPGSKIDKFRTIDPTSIAKIHQLLGDSAAFDYTLYENSCSLVFVDGSQAYDYAKSDTRAAMSIAKEGGVIIWHDYGIWEGVTKALEELEQRGGYDLRNIRGTSLVYWKKGAPRGGC